MLYLRFFATVLAKIKRLEQVNRLAVKLPTRYRRSPLAPSQGDLDNYLLNSYSWHLNRITEREFKDVIYDPEAIQVQLTRTRATGMGVFHPKVNAARDLLDTAVADQLENILHGSFGALSLLLSLKDARPPQSSRKLSALDWERRTKSRRHSAISRSLIQRLA